MVSNLHTGDLLIFEGYFGIDKAIKFFTQSQYSHVGIVWQCPKTKKKYVWEIGQPSKREQPIIGKSGVPSNGAHLTPLAKKIKNYWGHIYVKRLYCKQPLNLNKLTDFIAANLGKEYRSDFVGMWNRRYCSSILPIPFLTDEGDEWTCVELATKTYEHMGILTVSADTATLYAHDLVDESWNEDITVNPGYAFGPLEVVRMYNGKS
jgi:hypothetical protein